MHFYTCGELLLDLIYEPNERLTAVAGGSQLNVAMNLAKVGQQVSMIGVLGNDGPAEVILKRLKENKVDTSFLLQHIDYKTGLAFASLSETGKAVFSIYKSKLQDIAFNIPLPDLKNESVISFGSLAAIDPVWQSYLTPLLNIAHEKGALVFYDPNIRCGFQPEYDAYKVIANMSKAHIIRGSDEDFMQIFQTDNLKTIAAKATLSPKTILIVTRGSNAVDCFYQKNLSSYPVPALKQLRSTVGAGDAFNAGILFEWSHLGLNTNSLKNGIPDDLLALMMDMGVSFASDVCQSSGNQISDALAERTKSL
ncbi:MAG: fructokinase [Bacteroidales bacterium]|nr:fructokinase [Bacteroidales bacterium]